MCRPTLRSLPGLTLALLGAVVGVAACVPTDSPRILSAFFGLDDALPPGAGLLCPGAFRMDGMPLTFDVEIDQATLDADDFRVTTESGAVSSPLCATTAPALEENEDRTVLLIGAFGDARLDPPVRVDVVGSLSAEPPEAYELAGLSASVIPLRRGPTIVFAERLPAAEVEVGGNDCPVEGLVQVVRATWSGGVRALDGDEVGDAERRRYRVTLQVSDGSLVEVTPFALGDLNDQDNHHDLCLDRGGAPVSVRMPASTVIDPGDDPNPATVGVVRAPASR